MEVETYKIASIAVPTGDYVQSLLLRTDGYQARYLVIYEDTPMFIEDKQVDKYDLLHWISKAKGVVVEVTVDQMKYNTVVEARFTGAVGDRT